MPHLLRSATRRMLVCGFVAACGALAAASEGSEAAGGAGHTIEWPAVQSPVAKDPQMEAKIVDLLRQMTLEQKVAQMVQADIRYVTPDDERKYHLGSILNGGGAFPAMNKHSSISDWVSLADRFYDASMDSSQGVPAIPEFWGVDAVHGHNNVIGATLFPHNVGLGAAHDPDLIERIGAATAEEVAATGLDWTFAPTVAVIRDARWGRSYEGYSEQPDIVRAYAGRMVQGLQGRAGTGSFLDAHHIIATAKHYIGDGGTDQGIDRGDNLSSEQELLDIHAQGYITAIQAGVQTVMVSYNSWHGPKLHGHHYLIQEVLKNRMGFDGMVVSDWDGIDDVQSCSKDKCAQAINAGIDLFMVPDQWKSFIQNTVAQVHAGDISESRIDDAVTRILRVKMRYGLFEKGRPSSRPLANKRELLGSPEHRAIAREAVRKSLVLLKNEHGLLPLRRKLHVLVAGDGADSIQKQTGGWTLTWMGTENPNSDFPGATSIYSGIRSTVTAAGGTATLSPDGSYKTKPDVAIVVFGENPYAEWHGDIRSLDYHGPDGSPVPDVLRPSPETPMPGQWAQPLVAPSANKGAGASGSNEPDLALLQRLRQRGIPVVAVFLTGRTRGIDPELQAANAFVVAWLPGSEGGGIADVLFRNEKGGVNFDFTGKLAYAWPSGGGEGGAAKAGVKAPPVFPYGFGLSYCNQNCDAPLSRQPWQTQQSLTSLNMPASP